MGEYVIIVFDDWLIEGYFALILLEPLHDLLYFGANGEVVVVELESTIRIIHLAEEVYHFLDLDLLYWLVEYYPKICISLEYQLKQVILRPLNCLRLLHDLVSSLHQPRTMPVPCHRDGLRPENIAPLWHNNLIIQYILFISWLKIINQL